MVFNANDLSNWQNFPKGLKVLLLHGGGGDGDGELVSAEETRSKLESMDYIVTTFTDEDEALSAVFKNPECFHIAIVEVNTSAENESFKFLEAAKDHLPTIMVSNDHCITTSMKCIALGAVEFLQKPLSPEKLKNLWQHVVHKAFNDGGSSVADSLKLVQESDVPMLDIDTDMTTDENDTAPSTPQITQVSRLPSVDCSMENVNSSTEKENTEDQDIGESQLVDYTNPESDDSRVVVKEERQDAEKEAEKSETADVKNETTDTTNCHMTESNTSSINQSSGGIKNLSGTKTTRKKIDWTQELHKKFVQAVEHLGIDQAIPSRILEFMKVDGLTRHNVASHLQKYRMHRRNILPKEEHNNRWIQTNHRPIQRSYNGYPPQHRPVMAYPVWGVPSVHPQGAVQPFWPPPLPQLLSSGQPPQCHWKQPYPTVNGHTHTWGCPVGPSVTGTYCAPNFPGGYQHPPGAETGNKSNLDEEMLDQMFNEAMTQPWDTLPLGLKSPTEESVLTELSRKGITTVHSSSSCLINGSHRSR